MTCQPRQRSRRVCRAGGYWQGREAVFRDASKQENLLYRSRTGPQNLPLARTQRAPAQRSTSRGPSSFPRLSRGRVSAGPRARTREQICKGDFRESAIHGDREGADGCGSMSERRRRKEEETPAVERAVNHSDTDSDSVDSESDHEGRCRSFCASTPCQYSVLYALCSAVAAGHTCHMSATARCVLRTKPGAVIFVISTPYGVLNQPPAGSATNGGQRRRGIGKTMDGFSLDFKYQSLAPVLMIAGLGCMVVAHIFSSLLASLLA